VIAIATALPNAATRRRVSGDYGDSAGLHRNPSLQVSNAQTIYDLSGAFSNTSLHAGAGLGGSVDYFVGTSPNGPVFGGGITFGASEGASVTASVTTTQVCGTEGCVGELSDIVPDLTAPAAAATAELSQSASGPDQTSTSGASPTQQSGFAEVVVHGIMGT
jgi:hypothetical protein